MGITEFISQCILHSAALSAHLDSGEGEDAVRIVILIQECSIYLRQQSFDIAKGSNGLSSQSSELRTAQLLS